MGINALFPGYTEVTNWHLRWWNDFIVHEYNGKLWNCDPHLTMEIGCGVYGGFGRQPFIVECNTCMSWYIESSLAECVYKVQDGNKWHMDVPLGAFSHWNSDTSPPFCLSSLYIETDGVCNETPVIYQARSLQTVFKCITYRSVPPKVSSRTLPIDNLSVI